MYNLLVELFSGRLTVPSPDVRRTLWDMGTPFAGNIRLAN